MLAQRRALFVSHGGGPLPLLGDASHQEMLDCLRAIAKRISKPSRIILISAHWESAQSSLTAGEHPDLIYDYYGFPPESYQIQYPCPGDSALAQAIAKQLDKSGIQAKLDPQRGFDHGLFVPLKIMYPEADIPCVQLALRSDLDPLHHIELGRALQALADPSVLVIGSGFSFHNMQAFFAPNTTETQTANQAFEDWLSTTLTDPALTEDERASRLIDWQAAPSARYCHPREEHLLPLHVCYGFAGSACSTHYPLQILNKAASMFLWEQDAPELASTSSTD